MTHGLPLSEAQGWKAAFTTTAGSSLPWDDAVCVSHGFPKLVDSLKKKSQQLSSRTRSTKFICFKPRFCFFQPSRKIAGKCKLCPKYSKIYLWGPVGTSWKSFYPVVQDRRSYPTTFPSFHVSMGWYGHICIKFDRAPQNWFSMCYMTQKVKMIKNDNSIYS